MASKQQLILELKAKGIKLTKGQLNQLNDTVDDSAEAMTGATAAMAAMAVGVYALGQAFSHAIEVGREFDKTMSSVKAVSRASEEQFNALRKSARDFGLTSVYTAQNVAELQFELSKLGFATTEIENVTEAVLNLAAGTGSDLAFASEIAGGTLRAFQLQSTQMTEVTDIMGMAFASSALNLDRFANSMSYVAPIANTMGWSVKESTSVLATLAENMIHGSMAGTSFRKILLDVGKQNSKMSKLVGFNIRSFEDFTKALKVLKKQGFDPATQGADLVGKRAVSAFAILFNNIPKLEQFKTSLSDVDGTMKTMADTMLDNLEGDSIKFKAALDELSIQISDTFAPVLREATQGMTSFFNSIDEGDLKNYGIALSTAGLAMLYLKRQTIMQYYATIAATTAAKGLRAALIATGWGAIAIGVGLLAGALLDWFNVFGDNEDAVPELDENILKATKDIEGMNDELSKTEPILSSLQKFSEGKALQIDLELNLDDLQSIEDELEVTKVNLQKEKGTIKLTLTGLETDKESLKTQIEASTQLLKYDEEHLFAQNLINMTRNKSGQYAEAEVDVAYKGLEIAKLHVTETDAHSNILINNRKTLDQYAKNLELIVHMDQIDNDVNRAKTVILDEHKIATRDINGQLDMSASTSARINAWAKETNGDQKLLRGYLTDQEKAQIKLLEDEKASLDLLRTRLTSTEYGIKLQKEHVEEINEEVNAHNILIEQAKQQRDWRAEINQQMKDEVITIENIILSHESYIGSLEKKKATQALTTASYLFEKGLLTDINEATVENIHDLINKGLTIDEIKDKYGDELAVINSISEARQVAQAEEEANANKNLYAQILKAEKENEFYVKQKGELKSNWSAVKDFTNKEVEMIAVKMDAGLSYVDAVKAALEEVRGVSIFSSEDNETQMEAMQANIEMVQEYTAQAGSIISEFSQMAMDSAREQAREKIDALNTAEKAEMSTLKNSLVYKRAGDAKKAKMEADLNSKYAAMREKEEAAANAKLKKEFKKQQLVKVANVIMNTADGISKAVALNPMGGGVPGSIIAAVMGAAQLAIIQSQKAPTMARGGLIGGNQHNMGGTPIMAERGEFIMNRDAVENMGIDAMENMNQGGQSVNITFSGNVMSDDFITNEAIPKIREQLRRGESLE